MKKYWLLLIAILLGYICKSQESHTIELNKGWQLISSYVIPDTSDIEYIFRNADVEVVVSLDGVYWRSQNINTIDNWKHDHAYKVKMKSKGSITLSGEISNMSSYTLKRGINYIPVPVNDSINTSIIFDNANPFIVFVVDLETMCLYMPQLMFVNLYYLLPGKGYIAYMSKESIINY